MGHIRDVWLEFSWSPNRLERAKRKARRAWRNGNIRAVNKWEKRVKELGGWTLFAEQNKL